MHITCSIVRIARLNVLMISWTNSLAQITQIEYILQIMSRRRVKSQTIYISIMTRLDQVGAYWMSVNKIYGFYNRTSGLLNTIEACVKNLTFSNVPRKHLIEWKPCLYFLLPLNMWNRCHLSFFMYFQSVFSIHFVSIYDYDIGAIKIDTILWV